MQHILKFNTNYKSFKVKNKNYKYNNNKVNCVRVYYIVFSVLFN